MMVWAAWLACGSPTVPQVAGVPEGAAHLKVADGQLRLDGTSVGSVAQVLADPFQDADPGLTAALRPYSGRSLWMELPPTATFLLLRSLANAAHKSGVASVVVSQHGGERAYPLAEPPHYALRGTCPDGPFTVVGVSPLVTVSVQTGADGTWLVGTVRFLPVADLNGSEQAVDGLSRDCLAVPACAELYGETPSLQQACETGAASEDVPSRWAWGGEVGCVAPIAKADGDVQGLAPPLAETVRRLELGQHPLRMVMPEAQASVAAVLAVLAGFDEANIPTPAVGTTLLIQGNDGPPLCNAPIRDAAGLAQASAKWLGHTGRPVATRGERR